MKVLRTRDNLKRLGIRVTDDLTQSQRSELHKLRERGERGFFRGGRLIVDNHPNAHAPPADGSNLATTDRRYVTAARHTRPVYR